MSRTKELLIVRHAEVEAEWKGVCYGTLDVPLSDAGKRACDTAAGDLLTHVKPATIFHSGSTRTGYLAAAVARLCGDEAPLLEDARLQERNFGAWQGLTWDAAYASDPDGFHGLLEKPDSYRPPGGESTSELQQRAVAWLAEQTETRFPIIAISHSGPIAAIAGHALRLHPLNWSPWIVKHLEGVRLATDAKEECWEVSKIAFAVPAESK
ncbi:MAG: histidine phosphatase family protein [Planctomycetota bacterium]